MLVTKRAQALRAIKQSHKAMNLGNHSSLRAEPHNDILARYDSHFRTQLAEGADLIRTAQAIRYQVYCLERKFESRDEHDGGLERDAFDGVAVHALLFHRPTGDAIGTARLIPFTDMDVLQPIRQILRANGLRARDHVPLRTTAEISRFAISNHLRRRGDGAPECRSNLPCLGLVQELVRQSLDMGLTHWAAVMEPKLLRMLAVMGIHFTSVGPLVDHHGLRQPSTCELGEMLERLKDERPDHWMIVTDGGTLVPGAMQERRAA